MSVATSRGIIWSLPLQVFSIQISLQEAGLATVRRLFSIFQGLQGQGFVLRLEIDSAAGKG